MPSALTNRTWKSNRDGLGSPSPTGANEMPGSPSVPSSAPPRRPGRSRRLRGRRDPIPVGLGPGPSSGRGAKPAVRPPAVLDLAGIGARKLDVHSTPGPQDLGYSVDPRLHGTRNAIQREQRRIIDGWIRQRHVQESTRDHRHHHAGGLPGDVIFVDQTNLEIKQRHAGEILEHGVNRPSPRRPGRSQRKPAHHTTR